MMKIDLSPLHNLGDGGLYGTELKDGKHIIVKCSVCNTPLCDLWITQPNLPLKSKVIASCDYCNDRSYEVEVNGKFHTGPTEESGLVDIKNEFVDDSEETIFQRMFIKTKRLK